MHFLLPLTLTLGLTSLPALALPINDLAAEIAGILTPRATREEQTDTLLYSTSIDAFLAAKRAQNPPGLDWTDDGCTIVPDHPLDFDFSPSCKRHDFGYRNYVAQNRCSDADRLRIDQNWLRDMENQCDKEKGGVVNYFQRKACKAAAGTYYNGVRVLGETHFC